MMFHTPCRVLVAFLLTSFMYREALSQQYEGDTCRDDTGQSGVCKMLDSCEEARRNLDSGIMPKTCGFNKQMPIVCCTEISVRLDGQLKSREKCTEYAKFALPEVEVTTQDDNETELPPPGVVGGDIASPKEFPHMAAVGYGEENDIAWLCGGSLISERFVLTAAHCLASKSRGLAKWVRLGDLNLARTDDPVETQQFGIERLYRHPEYDPPARYNDIGLLKLNAGATFTDFARPACIHTEEAVPSTEPEAVGWGLVEWGTSRLSEDLLKVALKYVGMEHCNRTYAPLEGGRKLNRGIDEQTMLCVGDLGGGKDTCQGDSGGPLHVRLEDPPNMFDVIGITSFGTACGSKNSPAIYTRVSHYIPWIESIVWS